MSYENVLVIIPTYNERENIGLIIPEIRSLLPDVHILVVDDNSPDKTSPFVKELAVKYPGLFVLDRPAKEGLGKAYVAGFAWASSDRTNSCSRWTPIFRTTRSTFPIF